MGRCPPNWYMILALSECSPGTWSETNGSIYRTIRSVSSSVCGPTRCSSHRTALASSSGDEGATIPLVLTMFLLMYESHRVHIADGQRVRICFGPSNSNAAALNRILWWYVQFVIAKYMAWKNEYNEDPFHSKPLFRPCLLLFPDITLFLSPGYKYSVYICFSHIIWLNYLGVSSDVKLTTSTCHYADVTRCTYSSKFPKLLLQLLWHVSIFLLRLHISIDDVTRHIHFEDVRDLREKQDRVLPSRSFRIRSNCIECCTVFMLIYF